MVWSRAVSPSLKGMRRSPRSSRFRVRVLVAESGENAALVCSAVENDPRLELVDCVDHAAGAVARTVELAPEVLVLDIGLAGGAIAAVVEIGARMPGLPLVV